MKKADLKAFYGNERGKAAAQTMVYRFGAGL